MTCLNQTPRKTRCRPSMCAGKQHDRRWNAFNGCRTWAMRLLAGHKQVWADWFIVINPMCPFLRLGHICDRAPVQMSQCQRRAIRLLWLKNSKQLIYSGDSSVGSLRCLGSRCYWVHLCVPSRLAQINSDCNKNSLFSFGRPRCNYYFAGYGKAGYFKRITVALICPKQVH